jgi:hypothetical protein
MRPGPTITCALLAAGLLAGCGGGTTSGSGGEHVAGAGGGVVVAFDPRDQSIGCLQGKGIAAEKDPQQRDKIVILPATSQAYIEFAATSSEAQGRQIRNEAPGAQVIGPALFTVGDLSDDELAKVEACLDARGVRY